jgi:predicted nucleic-acid-binding Zn-ribbon protein
MADQYKCLKCGHTSATPGNHCGQAMMIDMADQYKCLKCGHTSATAGNHCGQAMTKI